MNKPASYNNAGVSDFNAFTAGKLTAEEVAAIAAARAANERKIDAEECAAGAAIRIVRREGINGRRPPKKRQATSGCGPRGRKDHKHLGCIPDAARNPSPAPPVPPTGVSKKTGLPYKQNCVLMS